MVSITNLKLWNDPGFTEGAVEVPRWTEAQTAPSGNPQAEFTTGLYPDKKDFWRRLQVKASYTDLLNVSYLQMAVTFNDGSSGFFFGWVDRVEMLSDNEGYEMCGIDWHVDYWRSYLPYATFGYGRVRRRSASGDYPMQQIPYRYVTPDFFRANASPEEVTIGGYGFLLYWLLVSFVKDTGTTTTTGYTLFPYVTDTSGNPYPGNNTSATSHCNGFMFKKQIDLRGSASPGYPTSFESVCDSTVFTDYGISASACTGAWILPKCPVNYTMTSQTVGGYANVYVITLKDGNHIEFPNSFGFKPDETLGYYYGYYAAYSDPVQTSSSEIDEFMSSEKETYVVTDMSSHVVYTLPPRIPVTEVLTRYEISPGACYMVFDFLNDDVTNAAWARAASLEAMVPAATFSIASNSWSDYLISGQRDYDIQQRKQANEAALVNGLTGSISGGTQGAMIGGLKSGSAGMTMGALGAAGSAMTAIGSYTYETLRADTLQSLEDSKAASQIDSVAYAGGEMAWLKTTHGHIRMFKLEKDDYSCDVYDAQISLNGIAVDEPTSDCSALCKGAGPLQVQNLIVGGSIPVEAKQYIKARFNSGVRLK